MSAEYSLPSFGPTITLTPEEGALRRASPHPEGLSHFTTPTEGSGVRFKESATSISFTKDSFNVKSASGNAMGRDTSSSSAGAISPTVHPGTNPLEGSASLPSHPTLSPNGSSVVVDLIVARHLAIPRATEKTFVATVSLDPACSVHTSPVTTAPVKLTFDSTVGAMLVFRQRLVLPYQPPPISPQHRDSDEISFGEGHSSSAGEEGDYITVNVRLSTVDGTIGLGVAACSEPKQYTQLVPHCGEVRCSFTVAEPVAGLVKVATIRYQQPQASKMDVSFLGQTVLSGSPSFNASFGSPDFLRSPMHSRNYGSPVRRGESLIAHRRTFQHVATLKVAVGSLENIEVASPIAYFFVRAQFALMEAETAIVQGQLRPLGYTMQFGSDEAAGSLRSAVASKLFPTNDAVLEFSLPLHVINRKLTLHLYCIPVKKQSTVRPSSRERPPSSREIPSARGTRSSSISSTAGPLPDHVGVSFTGTSRRESRESSGTSHSHFPGIPSLPSFHTDSTEAVHHPTGADRDTAKLIGSAELDIPTNVKHEGATEVNTLLRFDGHPRSRAVVSYTLDYIEAPRLGIAPSETSPSLTPEEVPIGLKSPTASFRIGFARSGSSRSNIFTPTSAVSVDETVPSATFVRRIGPGGDVINPTRTKPPSRLECHAAEEKERATEKNAMAIQARQLTAARLSHKSSSFGGYAKSPVAIDTRRQSGLIPFSAHNALPGLPQTPSLRSSVAPMQTHSLSTSALLTPIRSPTSHAPLSPSLTATPFSYNVPRITSTNNSFLTPTQASSVGRH